jgi:hypothetical protein
MTRHNQCPQRQNALPLTPVALSQSVGRRLAVRDSCVTASASGFRGSSCVRNLVAAPSMELAVDARASLGGLSGLSGELRSGPYGDLEENVFEVGLDRRSAHHELRGDLRVGESLHNKGNYAVFGLGKAVPSGTGPLASAAPARGIGDCFTPVEVAAFAKRCVKALTKSVSGAGDGLFECESFELEAPSVAGLGSQPIGVPRYPTAWPRRSSSVTRDSPRFCYHGRSYGSQVGGQNWYSLVTSTLLIVGTSSRWQVRMPTATSRS